MVLKSIVNLRTYGNLYDGCIYLGSCGETEMKPECELIGKNGNVFNLIALVRKTLRDKDLFAELDQFDTDLEELKKTGGNYDDVLVLIMKFVEVV
jgi:hypothetical protein